MGPRRLVLLCLASCLAFHFSGKGCEQLPWRARGWSVLLNCHPHRENAAATLGVRQRARANGECLQGAKDGITSHGAPIMTQSGFPESGAPPLNSWRTSSAAVEPATSYSEAKRGRVVYSCKKGVVDLSAPFLVVDRPQGVASRPQRECGVRIVRESPSGAVKGSGQGPHSPPFKV